MRHKQIQKQLSEYLDDALTPRKCERVENHLRTCQECGEILSELRQNRRWIANLQQPAPPGVWEAVQRQIAERNYAQDTGLGKRGFRLAFSHIWQRWIFRPATAGVGGLVTVGLVLMLVYLSPTQKPPEDTLDFYLMVHTENAIHTPLTSEVVVDSSITVVEPSLESATSAGSDDTQTVLDTYLDAYFGD